MRLPGLVVLATMLDVAGVVLLVLGPTPLRVLGVGLLLAGVGVVVAAGRSAGRGH